MPALPPDAMMTPAAGIGPASRRLSMPRALKLPLTCNCSSLSQTSAHGSPRAAPGKRISGVRRTKGLNSSNNRVCAATISARETLAGVACMADSFNRVDSQLRRDQPIWNQADLLWV